MISSILFLLELPLYIYYVLIKRCTPVRLTKTTLLMFRNEVKQGKNAFRLRNKEGKLLPACEINYIGFERLYFKVAKDES